MQKRLNGSFDTPIVILLTPKINQKTVLLYFCVFLYCDVKQTLAQNVSAN